MECPRTTDVERELMRRVADSDQKAFNLLFERYRNRLFNYLHKVTKSKETAEEIVLDVFLKIWIGRTAVTEIDNFEAFLFRVARNKALDFLRWVQRSRLQQMDLWDQMLQLKSEESADLQVLYSDTASRVQRAIDNLSPQRRLVFQLSRDHGLTYEQIAKRLHLSTHTVRNHLAASLQFIRTHLDPEMSSLCSLFLFTTLYQAF
jgi:RNA polymerase sigma-70 factor (ECF subfamily)